MNSELSERKYESKIYKYKLLYEKILNFVYAVCFQSIVNKK